MKQTLKSITLGSLGLGLAIAGLSLAQTKNAIPEMVRCGVKDVSPSKQAKVEIAIAKRPPLRPEALIVIPVYMHILHRTDGIGNVSNAVINNQIQVLNDSHDGVTGGANTQFQFVLAGITRTASNEAHNLDPTSPIYYAVKNSLQQGTASTLNIFICNPIGDTLGYGSYPWDYATNPIDDGVILDYRCLPGGTLVNYNQGDILVHEAGHWLGLLHTFQGGCVANGGDLVADTPAEASPAAGCPIGRNSCPTIAGLDPIENFMDYTYDACMYKFTAGQGVRMSIAWQTYRQ